MVTASLFDVQHLGYGRVQIKLASLCIVFLGNAIMDKSYKW